MWKQRKVLGGQALAEKENDRRSPSSGSCDGRGGKAAAEEWVYYYLMTKVIRNGLAGVFFYFLIPGDSTCMKAHQQAEGGKCS